MLFALALVVAVVFLYACTDEKTTDPKSLMTENLLWNRMKTSMSMHWLKKDILSILLTIKGIDMVYHIYNADGSIDAWFASPGRAGQWDWIYRSSTDGGKTQ